MHFCVESCIYASNHFCVYFCFLCVSYWAFLCQTNAITPDSKIHGGGGGGGGGFIWFVYTYSLGFLHSWAPAQSQDSPGASEVIL